mmetsp:Transcript_19267/g.28509  ORF Transcript_19267/g.28509 Transcript_19267/m.28509 type:complete len:253 (-) Transcript_19267:35-793(-)
MDDLRKPLLQNDHRENDEGPVILYLRRDHQEEEKDGSPPSSLHNNRTVTRCLLLLAGQVIWPLLLVLYFYYIGRFYDCWSNLQNTLVVLVGNLVVLNLLSKNIAKKIVGLQITMITWRDRLPTVLLSVALLLLPKEESLRILCFSAIIISFCFAVLVAISKIDFFVHLEEEYFDDLEQKAAEEQAKLEAQISRLKYLDENNNKNQRAAGRRNLSRFYRLFVIASLLFLTRACLSIYFSNYELHELLQYLYTQ